MARDVAESGDRPVDELEVVEVTPESLVAAVRAAVVDLERVADDAAYAANRARERLTRLELAIDEL